MITIQLDDGRKFSFDTDDENDALEAMELYLDGSPQAPTAQAAAPAQSPVPVSAPQSQPQMSVGEEVQNLFMEFRRVQNLARRKEIIERLQELNEIAQAKGENYVQEWLDMLMPEYEAQQQQTPEPAAMQPTPSAAQPTPPPSPYAPAPELAQAQPLQQQFREPPSPDELLQQQVAQQAAQPPAAAADPYALKQQELEQKEQVRQQREQLAQQRKAEEEAAQKEQDKLKGQDYAEEALDLIERYKQMPDGEFRKAARATILRLATKAQEYGVHGVVSALMDADKGLAEKAAEKEAQETAQEAKPAKPEPTPVPVPEQPQQPSTGGATRSWEVEQPKREDETVIRERTFADAIIARTIGPLAYAGKESVKAVPRGFGQTVGGVVSGVSDLIEGFKNRPRPKDERFLAQWGAEIKARAEELFPAEPETRQNFIIQVVEGIGSSIPFMATGTMIGALGRAAGLGQTAITALGTTAMAGLGAGAAADSGYELAAKFTDDEEQRLRFARLVGVVGLTEALPFADLLRRIGSGKSTILLNMAFESLEEGGQEGIQQFLQNLLLKTTGINPEQEVMEGVGRSAAVGAAAGLLTAGAASKLLGTDTEPQPRRDQVPEQVLKSFDELDAGRYPQAVPEPTAPAPASEQGEWFRGERQQNANGDLYFSTDKDVAANYGNVRKAAPQELPKNILVVDGKESLAETIGYKGDPLAERLDTPIDQRFDTLAKKHAQSLGYDSIRYENGTFGEPELVVFKPSAQPVATAPDQAPPAREAVTAPSVAEPSGTKTGGARISKEQKAEAESDIIVPRKSYADDVMQTPSGETIAELKERVTRDGIPLQNLLAELREAESRAKQGNTGKVPIKDETGAIMRWENQGAAYPEGMSKDTIHALSKFLSGKKLTSKQAAEVEAAVKYASRDVPMPGEELAFAKTEKPVTVNEQDIQDKDLVYRNGEWHEATRNEDGSLKLANGEVVKLDDFDTVKANVVVSKDMPEYAQARAEFEKQQAAEGRETPIEVSKPPMGEKPPELMTPEEIITSVSIRDKTGRKAAEYKNAQLIKAALESGKPVSSKLVDWHNRDYERTKGRPDQFARNITIPPGYVREGDRYVFKGASAPLSGTVSKEPVTGKEAAPPALFDVPESRRTPVAGETKAPQVAPEDTLGQLGSWKEKRSLEVDQGRLFEEQGDASATASAQKAVESARKAQEEADKGGYVAAGRSLGEAIQAGKEKLLGHFRMFGRLYSADKPMTQAAEKTYHRQATKHIRAAAAIQKRLGKMANISEADALAVAYAREEGLRNQLPDRLKALYDETASIHGEIKAAQQQAGVLGEGFPDGRRTVVLEKMGELRSKSASGTPLTGREQELLKNLKEELVWLDKFADYLPHSQVARAVIRSIYEESDHRGRRDLNNRLEQFSKQRKGKMTLREYVDAGIIAPRDADIRKLMMMEYGEAESRLANKDLIDEAYRSGFIVDAGDPSADRTWVPSSELSRRTLGGLSKDAMVHPAFAEALRELAGELDRPNTVVDRALATTKMGQFFNPKIIVGYNVLQRWLRGMGEENPVRNTRNLALAWKSFITQDDVWHKAMEGGLTQSPRIASREVQDQTYDAAVRQMSTDIGSTRFTTALKKIVEYVTGEEMTAKAWQDKGLRSMTDAILLPYKALGKFTWAMDQVQRLHTLYNLTGRGFQMQEAIDRAAKGHGAYSLTGAAYKNWASRVFFVHTFRAFMPIEMAKSRFELPAMMIQKLAGKEIPTYRAVAAAKALSYSYLIPTILDFGLRQLGWEEEREREVNPKLTDAEGKTIAELQVMPHWKYKKRITVDGEEREVVVGVNNIINMIPKWIDRATAPRPYILDNSFPAIANLMKWEVSPFYRNAFDVLENESSWGEPPPRGVDGKDWLAGTTYFFRQTFKLYDSAYKIARSDPESNIEQRRMRDDMSKALNVFEKVLLYSWGYGYTRKVPEERVQHYYTTLKAEITKAKSAARRYYSGARLQEEVDFLDNLYKERAKKIEAIWKIPPKAPKTSQPKTQLDRELSRELDMKLDYNL